MKSVKKTCSILNAKLRQPSAVASYLWRRHESGTNFSLSAKRRKERISQNVNTKPVKLLLLRRAVLGANPSCMCVFPL